MRLTRRDCLIGAAGGAALVGGAATPGAAQTPRQAPPAAIKLPNKNAFAPMKGAYLNAGSVHPVPLGALANAQDYLAARQFDGRADFSSHETGQRVVETFAKLINAAPDEVCFVQSTTAGENLIINALDLPRAGGGVITDTLHFFGSFYLYEELGERGMDVVYLQPGPDWRIDPEQFEAAITPNTRLISLSLVSTLNGFQHDLKRICEIAHARDVLVYADVIHALGTVPFDVKETGVDFASSATYKWLMGDMGLGFLYVRPDRLERLARPWFGYHQVDKFESHAYPYDPPGEDFFEIGAAETTRGYFGMGTTASIVAAQLDYSLDHLLKLGVENIHAYRQPMIDRVQEALPPLGFEPMTPPDSRTPLVAFSYKDARSLAPRLEAANVSVSLSRNRLRVSLAPFNTMDDVELLIDALKA